MHQARAVEMKSSSADVDVAKYWDVRARQFAATAPHKAAVYIDFSRAAHSLWAIVQRTAVLRNIHVGSDTKALDLGCGTGRWIATLGKLGAEVFGFDVAPMMRELASKVAAQLPRAKVIDDLAAIPKASLDTVISLNVLHTIHDPEALNGAIRSAAEKLRPGGQFCIIVDRSPGAFIAGRSGSDWQRLIEPHGFTLQRTGAAEYALPLTAYRKLVMAVRSLQKGDDDNYQRSLDIYNKSGWAIRIHEALVTSTMIAGLPLEWLVVGRNFVPPGTSLLIMTFERR